MKISVKVHANSSQEKLKKINDRKYEAWLKKKPVDGKANEALIKLLKKSFRKNIKMLSGFGSRNKIVEIL